MSILDHPEAQTLLNDAILTPEAVQGCSDRLTGFLQRYLPKFYRAEQRANAVRVIRGLLSGLERKTCEPIANQAERPRKPIQFFVGTGKWDDESVMTELREHVREELAEPDGVVVIDPSSFPQEGNRILRRRPPVVGPAGKGRQLPGRRLPRLRRLERLRPLDRRLYLPEDWAEDDARREKCHVPPEIKFQGKWRIALDLLDRTLPGLPHGWIVGDDELGRAADFRAALRSRPERYILDVPCNTTVRDLEQQRPQRRHAGRGRKREVPFRGSTLGPRTSPNRGGNGSRSAMARRARSRWTR